MPKRLTRHTRIATLARNKCEGRRSIPNELDLIEAETVDARTAGGWTGFRNQLDDASAFMARARQRAEGE